MSIHLSDCSRSPITVQIRKSCGLAHALASIAMTNEREPFQKTPAGKDAADSLDVTDGLKTLTPETWQEPDSIAAIFARLDRERGIVQMQANDWASLILGVDISPKAPPVIRRLFAVGRGTMLYGWFYYPLYCVGEDQIYRVAEHAVSHRFAELSGPAKLKSFADRIRWLNQQGVIQDNEMRGSVDDRR